MGKNFSFNDFNLNKSILNSSVNYYTFHEKNYMIHTLKDAFIDFYKD